MKSDDFDAKARKLQQQQWETTFTEEPDLYGTQPSYPAQVATALFRNEGMSKILELGAGQGRDTFHFAQNGFSVHALEYSPSAVAAIKEKATDLGFTSEAVDPICHDARNALPFEDSTLEACYSHMLFNMAFTTQELEFISSEILRVLKPGGLNIYTARHTGDADYKTGIHRGEDMYEADGFIVHFFNKEKIEYLARGFQLLETEQFDEGSFPRKLFLVVERKPFE